MINEMM